jgi:NADH-quinone oxidoreductase subunit G
LLGSGYLFFSGRPAGAGDSILRHTDKNPNRAGVTALGKGVLLRPFAELATQLDAGKFSHVLALGAAASDPGKVEALGRATLIVLATHEGPFVEKAAVVLPASSWAESDGTFVNAKGLAQESERAITPQGESLPAWKLVALLGRALKLSIGWNKLSEVRAQMAPEAGASRAAAAPAAPAL